MIFVEETDPSVYFSLTIFFGALAVIAIILVFIFVKSWVKHLVAGIICLGILAFGISFSIAAGIAATSSDPSSRAASYFIEYAVAGWSTFAIAVGAYVICLVAVEIKARKSKKVTKELEENREEEKKVDIKNL
jgi:hypothetical protein